MLPVWILFLDFRMLAILRDRRENEFVILLAAVFQNETDLFALAHLDARGLETHFSAALEHLYLDDACGPFRVAGHAGRERFVAMSGSARAGECRQRGGDGRRRRQQETATG